LNNLKSFSQTCSFIHNIYFSFNAVTIVTLLSYIQNKIITYIKYSYIHTHTHTHGFTLKKKYTIIINKN
jgi:hypothetical protein